VSISVQETEKIFLTIDEVEKLYNTDYDKYDVKRAFLFACHTGLRISDVKSLTWGQIREGKLFFTQKKTKGVEYLPLNESAKEMLYLGIESNVIPLPETKIFRLLSKSEDIGSHLRKWAKKAGINKYITFHTSRHTFATMALTCDVPLPTVSKILGHKSINTTQIYAKIVDHKVVEAVNKLPSFSKS
jgi:integrase